MDHLSSLLAFNRMPGVGPRTVLQLLRHWSDLSVLFRMTSSQLIAEGLTARLADAISSFPIASIDRDWRWQKGASNRHLLLWGEANYPALLKEIHDPPLVLYAVGNLDALAQPTLGMVGTRYPTSLGSSTASRFAHELSQKHITIVSGLALGIDKAAHSGCLAAEGKTIAVMGTGIDIIYPAAHVSLAEKIIKNGLLLSEFPLKSTPKAGHFPRRNRIISGLSLATLVVEAAVRSGSLITARLALEQNRDVLVVPGSLQNTQARGCLALLQQGATLVTSTQDILSELHISLNDQRMHAVDCLRDNSFATQAYLALASETQNLVKCLDDGITTIDSMVESTGLPVEKIICAVTELEFIGVIKAVPGGYKRC